MKKFEYEITISAGSEAEADAKMRSLIILASKLSAEELIKVAHVVSDPAQLALIKSKLM